MSKHIYAPPAERQLAVGLLLERRSDEGHRRLASLLFTLNPAHAPPRARHLESLAQRLRLLAPQPHQIHAGSLLIRDLGGSSSIRVVRCCCIRKHTSAYVSICQHTSATPNPRHLSYAEAAASESSAAAAAASLEVSAYVSVRQRTSSLRQHYVSIREHELERACCGGVVGGAASGRRGVGLELQGHGVSVFVLLYQLLRQCLYFCTSQHCPWRQNADQTLLGCRRSQSALRRTNHSSPRHLIGIISSSSMKALSQHC
jgi:hypothetical protein